MPPDLVPSSIEQALGAGVDFFCASVQHDAYRRLGCLRLAHADTASIGVGIGFFAFSGDTPKDPRGAFVRDWVLPGLLTREDFVASSWSIAPRYLRRQIELACEATGRTTLDAAWIESPEIGRVEFGEEDFYNRLREAFGALEEARSAGLIKTYGLSVGRGLQAAIDREDRLDLKRILGLAQDLAGHGHGLKWLLMPGQETQATDLGLTIVATAAAPHQPLPSVTDERTEFWAKLATTDVSGVLVEARDALDLEMLTTLISRADSPDRTACD